jgi:hypothetical protein
VLSTIRPLITGETGQSLLSIAGEPALDGPAWQVELTGESSKWNVVLEQRPQLLKPSQGCRALVLRQCGQEWRLRRCHALGAHRIRTHHFNIC